MREQARWVERVQCVRPRVGWPLAAALECALSRRRRALRVRCVPVHPPVGMRVLCGACGETRGACTLASMSAPKSLPSMMVRLIAPMLVSVVT